MFVEEKTIKTLSRTGGHAEESLKSLPSESGSNVLSSDRTLISLRFSRFERAINTRFLLAFQNAKHSRTCTASAAHGRDIS